MESTVNALLPSNFRNNENVKYGVLRLVDIPAEVAANQPWFNQTLTTVNDAVVRLGIFEGEFPWHRHVEQDEFFLVLDGEISLDVEGCDSIVLGRHQGFTVPKGTRHRPRSSQRSVVLMVEKIGIVPTGDYPPPEAVDPDEEETPQIDAFTIEDPPSYPGPGA
jgi:mannose-6-phosphate isomerase-like protein (cupin superfamily)